MNTIGERIKFLRDAKGYSMGKLEKLLGFSGGSFDKWEKDRSVPGGKALIELSKFFSVSADWILTGENKQQVAESISPEGVELLAKFYRLPERDQGRIEGMIDGILLKLEGTEVAGGTAESSRSKNGREDAAAKQGA